MKLDENIKKQIDDFYHKTDDNIHSVSIGFKYKNNIRTDEISLIFGVTEKKSINDLSKDSLLPSEIKIGDTLIKTDVIEQEPFRLFGCYSQNPLDYEISRLRTINSAATFKGGMEIRPYPKGSYTYTIPDIGSYIAIEYGTLGFFATDNIDGKIVGVTNNHVASNGYLFAGEIYTDYAEISNPYNTIESDYWYDGNMYSPGAISQTELYLIQSAMYVKRYLPISSIKTNYIDCALVIVPPTRIDNNSYQVWQPSTQPTYPASMPFATTAELDNLVVTNPNIYCTGRTSGPIGWGLGECKINITNIGLTTTIGPFHGNKNVYFEDLIGFQTPLNTSGMAGGDSGSCVMADIGGVRKIIGLFFGGNSTVSLFNRIDRVASLMNISAFATPTNTSYPTSTSITTSNISKYGDKASIIINGKTYYQTGLTYNTSYSSIN